VLVPVGLTATILLTALGTRRCLQEDVGVEAVIVMEVILQEVLLAKEQIALDLLIIRLKFCRNFLKTMHTQRMTTWNICQSF
jgi:hypothetical protein